MDTIQMRRVAQSALLAGGITLALCATSARSQAQTLVNASGTATGIDGNTLLGDTQVTLAAGSYIITPTNPSLNSSVLYTAWSYNAPWTWYV